MTAVFVLVTLLLQVFVPYHRYVIFLKWLTLSLLAYAAVLFTVHVPWGEVALRTSVPQLRRWTPRRPRRDRRRLRHDDQPLSVLLAGLRGGRGHADPAGARPAAATPAAAGPSSGASGGTPGAACSTRTSPPIFIILATAVTLHAAGHHDIDTAAQAASALRPLAGDFAFLLFALGILGVGLIGVPVLAGSAAYALCRGDGLELGARAEGHAMRAASMASSRSACSPGSSSSIRRSVR